MEDSDKENLQKETLETQFKIVKKETNTSTVCQFGDMKIRCSLFTSATYEKYETFYVHTDHLQNDVIVEWSPAT